MGLFDFLKKNNVNDLSASDDYDGQMDDFEDDYDESLDVYDAADIWFSNGMDEAYTFGYSEDELRRALDD